jgi:sRNA-binding carbon storage regulator CsrA
MLNLHVRVGETVKIGDVATVTVEQKSGQMVRLVFDADRSLPITIVEPGKKAVSWGLTGVRQEDPPDSTLKKAGG